MTTKARRPCLNGICVCVAGKVSKLPMRLNQMVDVKLCVPIS